MFDLGLLGLLGLQNEKSAGPLDHKGKENLYRRSDKQKKDLAELSCARDRFFHDHQIRVLEWVY
jgi:hypothetical protein